MRTTSWVNICNIIIDRHSISEQTLDLAMKVKLGEIKTNDIPPIKLIMNKDGAFKLKDGRHRLTAFKLLGKKLIKANYYKL